MGSFSCARRPSPASLRRCAWRLRTALRAEAAGVSEGAAMTCNITFHAICGARNENPLCYLLAIDNFNILLDLGWNDQFDTALLEPLKLIIPRVDCVLLSHPDLSHLGALPYAVKRLGLCASGRAVKVYATLPVWKMGQMCMYDVVSSRGQHEQFDLFDLDDVDKAFENIQQLKYSEKVRLGGAGTGITITAYAAGHMVGGSIWNISKDTEEFVYAVDYNHYRERHLNGALLETLERPSILITDAYNAMVSNPKREVRDAELQESILATLRGGGNVLIPVDTAGRVLELLLVLENVWSYRPYSAYPIALLHHVATSTVDFARSQLEWMSDSVQKNFQTSGGENPFAFKSIRLCNSLEQLGQIQGPMVVLATSSSLECGFAKDLFMDWAWDPKNLVLFTDRSFPSSLARLVMGVETPTLINVQVKQKVQLNAEELEQLRQAKMEKIRQELQEKRAAEEAAERLRSVAQAMEVDGGEVPSVEEVTMVEGIDSNNLNRDRFRLVPTAQGFLMFPCVERCVATDDYGEVINLSDYMSKEAFEAKKNVAHNIDRKAEEIAAAAQPEEIPYKYVSVTKQVALNCQVKYVDLEGRTDGTHIRKILTHIKPRRLILVHGTPDSTERLRDHCVSFCQEVYTPNEGDVFEFQADTRIWKVSLDPSLLQGLEMVQVNDYELCYMDSQVAATQNGLMLKSLPTTRQLMRPGCFVGDVKLADLRQLLAKAGLQTELFGGVLVCNGLITIRKTEGGVVSVEGSLCEEYYQVRQLLYDQYHII